MKWTCSLHINELYHVGMSRVYTQMWAELFSLLSSSCRTSRVYSTRIHPCLTLLVSVFFFYFSSYFCPSARIRQAQNTTSFHNSGKMNLNSIGNSTVRGHAPFKYPPCNTKAPVQIQTRSESPRATLPFPLRKRRIYPYVTRLVYQNKKVSCRIVCG